MVLFWLNGSFLVAGVTLAHSSFDVVYRANSIFLRSLASDILAVPTATGVCVCVCVCGSVREKERYLGLSRTD